MKVCTSCNETVFGNYVEFKCPKCLKQSIVRCLKCRENSTPFVCSKCGFTGP